MNPFLDYLDFRNGGMHRGRRCIIVMGRFRALTSLGLVEVIGPFLSDGGSINDAAAALVGNGFGDALEEFVIHDWLYSSHNKEFTRSEADFILKELLWNCILRTEKSRIKRARAFFRIMAIYSAVRICGASRFKGNLP